MDTAPGAGPPPPKRRFAVALPLLLAVLAARPGEAAGQAGRERFDVFEATIPEMRRALEEGRVTSRELVIAYLERIGRYEGELNATLAVNPDALFVADSLDRERAAGRVAGPLHGIPVALKDNIQTLDMPTTGGTLAFAGWIPPYDATLTRNLREAGAVLLAKTVMTELANWVASGMPGNYSALGGYGMNPYDPRPDPRAGTSDGRPLMGTGGSSSGIGTAASLWAANVGTETSGSILSPSSATMLVGVKPTVGRVSRWGVIPLTSDQDTPGPMARTVTDAAILLGALEGADPDPHDPATGRCRPPAGRDYTAVLDTGALAGARIGIPRASYYEPLVGLDASVPRGGLEADELRVMEEAIAVLRAHGAVVVDPADIPSVTSADPTENLLAWRPCAGLDGARGHDGGCSVVLAYGMKRDFQAWLRTLGDAAPVASLAALREWNRAHAGDGAIRYGQARLDLSDRMDPVRDRARYRDDRARDLELAAVQGVDAVVTAYDLDALLFPGSAGAGVAARPGYPSVTVPFGRVSRTFRPPLPAGFAPRRAPMGVTFTGPACSEPRLLALAYAFEQATKRRVPPPFP